MTIAGAVLAAGLSERMGGTVKQLLAFGGDTMLGRVVAEVERTSLDPIVVVTGHEAGAVEAGVALRRARFVRNPRYRQGNMSSLHAAVAALGPVDAVMVVLGDQPEITAGIIETVAAAWAEFRPFAAVARYRGAVGHPWVLSAEAVAAAAALHGTKALWGWLTEAHAADVLEVELGRDEPGDVNTPEDYAAVLSRLGLPEPPR